MANDDPIEQQFPVPPGSDGSLETALRCEQWEALAAEAVEGTLSEEQRESFERHRRICHSCAQIWEQSRRGAQWLHFLGERAEPPAGLAEAIVAATSGADRADRAALRQRPVGSARPKDSSITSWNRNPAPLRRSVPAVPRTSEYGAPGLGAPGLLMTAAMAFFSLALTVYLLATPLHRGRSEMRAAADAGPLAAVHLSRLTPAALRRAAVRQYYSLEERSAKFYDNLLVVREVEAEVRDLSAPSAQSQDGAEPQRLGPSPSSRNGGAAPVPRTPNRLEVSLRRDSQRRPEKDSGANLASPSPRLDQPMSSFSYQDREGRA